MNHPFARLDGLAAVLAILGKTGAICPECGYATRRTSKRWAVCKKCGRKRIPAMDVDDIQVRTGDEPK